MTYEVRKVACDHCQRMTRVPEARSDAGVVGDLVEALRLMRLAFGDPMTRRALGGHNERQMTAVLASSAALAKYATQGTGGGERDLRWAVYTSAYAVLRDYDNHPAKDRGLINAGDQRIPNLIADGVVSRYFVSHQPAISIDRGET